MKKAAKNPQRLRVALLIESSRAYGRGILSGVAKYMREHGDWSISLEEHRLCDKITASLRNWKGDGILTRIEHRTVTQFVKRMGLPTVSLRKDLNLNVPRVLTDNALVSRMAFEHLKERGFRHFAFCGFNGADYSDERRDGFIQCVHQAGLPCHVYQPPLPAGRLNTEAAEEVGPRDQERLGQWLRQLPKPAGLMACNDMRGQQVLTACRAAGISVPDEIAVIGVDNEEAVCDLCDPPLSSVVPDTNRVGYEAAALLAAGMAGRKLSAKEVMIGPLGVTVRRSTEMLAIEDREVAAVARYIREHTNEAIDVNDLLRAVPMSRSTLDRRYRRVMGRSPKDDILQARLNRAKQLLAETRLPVAAVAEKIGMQHTEYLNRFFKKKTGLTPAQYRARRRTTDARGPMPGDAEHVEPKR